MKLKCPFCNREIEVANQLPTQTVIACPYTDCQKQFHLTLPKTPRVVPPQEMARRYNSGEDLIWRGEYSAWQHVWIGFFLHALLIAVPLEIFFHNLQHLPSNEHPLWCAIMAFIAGVLWGCVIFGNRWHRIEKMASRFCFGWLQVSLIYVPLIVIGYAYYVAFYLAFSKLRSR